MKSTWWLVACGLTACSGRCGEAGAGNEPAVDDELMPLEMPEGLDAAVLLPPRCAAKRPEQSELSAIGNAVSLGDGLVLGAVAQGKLRLVGGRTDVLADAFGDVPPPALSVSDDRLYAAYFAPGEKNQQRVRIVVANSNDGPFETVFEVSRARDESLAVDLAPSAGVPHLVWHESGVLTLRAPTRSVPLTLPSRAPAPTPKERLPESVLEMPRIVADAAGLRVVALARAWDAPEEPSVKQPKSSLEGAGELRSRSWLVGFRIEASGHVHGPVSLTSHDGHVDAFDLLQTAADLVVFARDARESTDGGGSLVRIEWPVRGDPRRSVLQAAGVGTAPISAYGGVLVYGTTLGEALLVPLDERGVGRARASREPALDQGRIVGLDAKRGAWVAGDRELGWVPCRLSP